MTRPPDAFGRIMARTDAGVPRTSVRDALEEPAPARESGQCRFSPAVLDRKDTMQLSFRRPPGVLVFGSYT
jgi:hypothetical protein